jgi:hypothetical protein
MASRRRLLHGLLGGNILLIVAHLIGLLLTLLLLLLLHKVARPRCPNRW